jgi:general secretion pathway protein A
MYTAFYGLHEQPFELTPDPRFLYLTPGHREALSNLQYGLSAAKPVTLLVGEAGTGKTTLLKATLETDACRCVRALHLTNPTLTRNEFVELLGRGFGLTRGAMNSKAALLAELEALLRERRSRGEITALIVDEAQSLSVGLLEEIRLLANIETTTEKLLPLVLVGQPALGENLERPELRQLKQRVALRCDISPFTMAETAVYIATRIGVAGGSATQVFTWEAVGLIHEHSRGIPRTINVICDNALITGHTRKLQPVDGEIIREVARDFSFSGHAFAAAAAAIPAQRSSAALAPTQTVEGSASERRKPESRRFGFRRAARRPFAMFGTDRDSQ